MTTSYTWMQRRRASTIAVAAAAALAVMGAAGCDDAKDTASSAASAVGSAAASATDKASSAVSSATDNSATAPDGSGVLESPTASAPPAPVVPSTSIDSPDGTAVTFTDPAFIAEYAARGYEKGYLGKPLGPVVDLPRGGRFQTFQGGSIYYNPTTKKAYSVHGAIGGYWGTTGHETGTLGYPAGEETPTDKGLEQKFDNGTLLDTNGTVTSVGK